MQTHGRLTPFILWMTGLSGSGKTTLAREIQRRLVRARHSVYVLDGDIIREGLCSDLGFSDRDRSESVRRSAEVAAMFAEAGVCVIAALICPRRSHREQVRARLREFRFFEVFVSTPLAVCEQRDVKGLYVRARRGEIFSFTGVSAPYEPPEAPDIEIATDSLSVDVCAARVIERLGLRPPPS